MAHFGIIDWTVVVVYFVAMASLGPFFARRNTSTEGYFVGNRSFPAWLLGVAMFATSISSVTVVGYPGDAYKTAYLRLLLTFTLPVAVFIASFAFLPYYRRSRCTSAFEYLEARYGPGVRLYAACAFLVMQVVRISMILYLVSLVFQQMTGATPYVCIVVGGLVIASYTMMGGIRAVVTAQFVQTFLLWGGAFLCFFMVIRGIDGGIGAVISTAIEDGKFMLGDLNTKTMKLEPKPWFSLQDTAIIMMLLVGFNNWLTEYSSNQNVIQKYVAAKDPREATKSIWICCILSVPAWAFFMFLGTSLYVFYKQNPDPGAVNILMGANGAKADSILPFFCVNNIPSGLSGFVITGILAAAMSASSSSINAISAVSVTDIYRRHLAKGRDDRHYVFVARAITAASALIMMVGAVVFLNATKVTLQDTATKASSLLWGGILGIYLLGFLTRRGDARAVGIGICCTLVFTLYMFLIQFGVINKELFMNNFGMSENMASWFGQPIHTYYAGIFGNLIMFLVAYAAATLLGTKRDLTNLTYWTSPKTVEEK